MEEMEADGGDRVRHGVGGMWGVGVRQKPMRSGGKRDAEVSALEWDTPPSLQNEALMGGSRNLSLSLHPAPTWLTSSIVPHLLPRQPDHPSTGATLHVSLLQRAGSTDGP